MTNSNKDDHADEGCSNASAESAKLTYAKPKLIVHGTLREITLANGNASNKNDGGSSNRNNSTA
jgi:hypothetical protein